MTTIRFYHILTLALGLLIATGCGCNEKKDEHGGSNHEREERTERHSDDHNRDQEDDDEESDDHGSAKKSAAQCVPKKPEKPTPRGVCLYLDTSIPMVGYVHTGNQHSDLSIYLKRLLDRDAFRVSGDWIRKDQIYGFSEKVLPIQESSLLPPNISKVFIGKSSSLMEAFQAAIDNSACTSSIFISDMIMSKNGINDSPSQAEYLANRIKGSKSNQGIWLTGIKAEYPGVYPKGSKTPMLFQELRNPGRGGYAPLPEDQEGFRRPIYLLLVGEVAQGRQIFADLLASTTDFKTEARGVEIYPGDGGLIESANSGESLHIACLSAHNSVDVYESKISKTKCDFGTSARIACEDDLKTSFTCYLGLHSISTLPAMAQNAILSRNVTVSAQKSGEQNIRLQKLDASVQSADEFSSVSTMCTEIQPQFRLQGELRTDGADEGTSAAARFALYPSIDSSYRDPWWRGWSTNDDTRDENQSKTLYLDGFVDLLGSLLSPPSLNTTACLPALSAWVK